jgi:hypothetical protein
VSTACAEPAAKALHEGHIRPSCTAFSIGSAPWPFATTDGDASRVCCSSCFTISRTQQRGCLVWVGGRPCHIIKSFFTLRCYFCVCGTFPYHVQLLTVPCCPVPCCPVPCALLPCTHCLLRCLSGNYRVAAAQTASYLRTTSRQLRPCGPCCVPGPVICAPSDLASCP